MNKYINILIVVIGSIFLSSASQASIIKDESAESLGYLYDFGSFGSFTTESLIPPATSNSVVDLLSLPTYVCSDEFACPMFELELEFELRTPDRFNSSAFNYSLTVSFEFFGTFNGQRYNSMWNNPNEHIFSQLGTYSMLGECDECKMSFTVSEIVAPESVSAPASLALFASALGLLGWSARRRRAGNA